MYRFFGSLVCIFGLFCLLAAAANYFSGDTGGAVIGGIIAFGLMAGGSHLVRKGEAARIESSFEEIEDGLHACLVGPQDLIVRVSPEFHENHEDIPGQKPTAESRRELKHCNVVCPEIVTETDALAVRTALWNVYVPCWNCGEEADYDESKCDYCGKKLWRKPLRVHFERVTAASP